MNLEDPATIKTIKIYEQMGTQLNFHSLENLKKLLQPWKLEGENFIPLLQWNGFSQSELSKEDVSAFGPMGGGFGAYLSK